MPLRDQCRPPEGGRRCRAIQRALQIELFFKWIKQNLKVKTFLGTSENAVLTQLWIALCVYLVLAYLSFLSKIGLTMQQMLRLLQLNLFERRELNTLFEPPMIMPNPQLALL